MSKKDTFLEFRELMYDLEAYLSDHAYRERNQPVKPVAHDLAKRVARMIVQIQEAMGLDNCDSL